MLTVRHRNAGHVIIHAYAAALVAACVASASFSFRCLLLTSTGAADAQPMSREAIVAGIRADYDTNYFISGEGEMAAYAPDCVFRCDCYALSAHSPSIACVNETCVCIRRQHLYAGKHRSAPVVINCFLLAMLMPLLLHDLCSLPIHSLAAHSLSGCALSLPAVTPL